jgi:hypothetical protein
MSTNVPPIIVCAIVTAAFASLSAAQETGLPEGWVSFDDITQTATAPALQIVSSDLSELVLTVTTPGVVSAAVNEDDVEYRKLEFPGYYHSTEVGYPLLPAVRQLIAVPEGCEVEVSVSLGNAVHYHGSVLYPVPATVVRYTPEGWEYLDEEFAIDEDAYSQSGYYPSEIASVSAGGSLRGQGVALLTVYPAQYDAVAVDLRVYPSLTITLSFVGGDGGVSTDIGPLSEIARGVVLNYQGMGGGQIRGSAGPGTVDTCETVAQCAANETDFLMIVHDSLMIGSADWPESLAQHRADWNGWNVAIVPSAAVVKRWGKDEMSDDAMQDFIRAVYDSCDAEHMDDGKLGYVLLVGDAKDATRGGAHYWLPAHEQAVEMSTATTDHWYACVEGEDNYADLMIGRLAADHQSELQWQVKKIIAYEENASSGDPWRDDVLLSCGFAWKGWRLYPRDCVESDSTKASTVWDTFYSARSILEEAQVDSIVEVHAHDQAGAFCWNQYASTKPINRRQVNAGRHFVQLCAHGWHGGTYTFAADSVAVLTNADTGLPFWMTYACGAGAFDWVPDFNPAHLDTLTDCLGEYLLHNNGMNGAVAYFGGTESSVYPWMYLGPYVWEAFINEHLHSLGEAIIYAKTKYLSVTGGGLGEHLMYNLLGDPALNVFLTDVGYGDRPDYVVTPSDLHTSPAFPQASGTAQLQAVIHNKSNCNPDTLVAVEFTLCERDGSGCATVGTAWVAPAAWGTATAGVTWNVGAEDSIGQRLLKVRVDPDTLQAELFKDNNEAANYIGSYFPERSGFPVHVGGLTGLSTTVAEINNDATTGPEVVVATRDSGKVAVYSCADGDSIWGFTVPDGQRVLGSPAVGDLDRDGSPEVVVCYGDSVKAYHTSDWSLYWAWPAATLLSGPVLGDFVDGDGYLETVVTRYSYVPAELRAVFISCAGDSVWEQAFSPDWWGTVLTSSLEPSPSAADLDGDGRVDIVASHGGGWQPSAKHVVAADGDGSWNWTLDLGGAEYGAEVYPCNPVVGEVDASSAGLEVLAGKETLDCIGTTDNEGTLCWSKHVRGYLSGVSLANLDEDDPLEIVVATYGAPGDPDSIVGRVYVFESTGTPVDSLPLEYGCTSQPIVADLDGDGDAEIVVSSTRPYVVPPYVPRDLSHLDILTFTGGELERFIERPLLFWGRLISTPTIKDTNDNGHLEIWLVDGEGNLHCFEYQDAGTPSRWACFQHDERHTGTYETPVSGTLGSPASWWGDYLMIDDVTVDADSLLLIQPGCTVRVQPFASRGGRSGGYGTQLTIRGHLEVGGDPVRKANLVSGDESPAADDWRGIVLESHSSAVIADALVAHAYIGIDAADSLELNVRGCILTENDLAGIKCSGSAAGQSDISISENHISETQTGIQLASCAAPVHDNVMEECSSYGIDINGDYGSDIRGNWIHAPLWDYSFSGIRVQNSYADLVVAENTIGDSLHAGVPNRGIEYKSSGPNDAAMIKDNTIFASAETKSTAMYFYNGKPYVRANTLTGKAFVYAFYVTAWGQPPTKRPRLGEAVGGSCAACGDTTLPGCNSVVPDDGAEYYVYVSLSPDTVRAQCNYWCPAPDSTKFHGKVKWWPPLRDGRGASGQDEVNERPSELALLPNSPNPFNPETVFRFALPQAGHVTLGIYDLAGRLVRTLIDWPLSEGWQTVAWDGRGDGGERVASGVYFCRLGLGGRSLSRKVVVLK